MDASGILFSKSDRLILMSSLSTSGYKAIKSLLVGKLNLSIPAASFNSFLVV